MFIRNPYLWFYFSLLNEETLGKQTLNQTVKAGISKEQGKRGVVPRLRGVDN
jgi:hypothetical protein